ncbi:MAG: amino acid ABC transporter substrate-binding protein [Deltaproteobacteria bacterium]|nr:amino acid ABC transporter substrate-binding protein [Deltaproteobacteria bacterium]
MIKKTGKQPRGIMIETLQIIASKHGYTVKIDRIPRKRVVLRLNSGKLDATPLAKEWISNPENFEFTDSIIRVRDVLFSLQKLPLKFEKIEDLFGKEIGTHLGYKYPMLTTYFKNNRILRNDTISEKAMFEMLLRKRTDAAIINELVGKWHIRKNLWKGKFVASKKDVGGFDYRIMFARKWRDFVHKFNKELSLMKQNGLLEKIISKYKAE